jgi:putative membrane protein
MYYILSFLVSGGVIFFIAGSSSVEGITLDNGYTSALLFAVVLALVNLFLGTAIRFITFPIRFITLGAFSFVIYASMVYITDRIVESVSISGIIPIIVIALSLTVIGFFMKLFK